MFQIKNKNMYLNRGDAISINLQCNEEFSEGDIIKFSICKKGNYSNIIFQKTFQVQENTNNFSIDLTSDDTRLGDPLKGTAMVYWYEIELNGNTTLIGFDEEGGKEFVLYPEATEV